MRDMTSRTYRLVVVAIFVATFAATMLMLASAGATASTVEAPDRSVEQVRVTYVEVTATPRHPYRRYFETNDGAAYRYLNYRLCAAADAVSDRACRTAFWYAR